MDGAWVDRLARQVAGTGTTRRGVLRLGTGAALAGLAPAPDEAAAACQRPKRPCDKGRRCCSGRCTNGRCARCPAGTAYVAGPDGGCWRWLAWGSKGSGDGEFQDPYGVAVGGAGQVYVADTGNHRLQEFDATGGFVRKWGSPGSGDGEFDWPRGVAVGPNGHVYVADESNHRIVRVTPR